VLKTKHFIYLLHRIVTFACSSLCFHLNTFNNARKTLAVNKHANKERFHCSLIFRIIWFEKNLLRLAELHPHYK